MHRFDFLIEEEISFKRANVKAKKVTAAAAVPPVPPPLQKMITKTTSRDEFFDVQFLVENKVIVAHRIILADRSEVFRILWNENNPHKRNEAIPIVDTSHDCFSNFINAIYYGTTPTDSEMCLEMVKLAERYDVQDIKITAEGCVIKSIGKENAIHILITSELHKADKIKQTKSNPRILR